MFAAMFMCLMVGCGVEVRGADVDSTDRVSASSDALTGPADQACVERCLEDCGAVCQGSSDKASCVGECRADNQECRAACAAH
ncbi:MAG TPA: hypothetical protein VHW23_15120 [Kofleriaceae bacterium]|nr:hypothetical protein [Kofleriaceae bacterium]